jgi:hypothetical protein
VNATFASLLQRRLHTYYPRPLYFAFAAGGILTGDKWRSPAVSRSAGALRHARRGRIDAAIAVIRHLIASDRNFLLLTHILHEYRGVESEIAHFDPKTLSAAWAFRSAELKIDLHTRSRCDER